MVRPSGLQMEVQLNKIITALAAIALVAAPMAASARDFGGGRGGGGYDGGGQHGGGYGGGREYRGDRGDRGGYAGAAILGLALGALIGSSTNAAYGPSPYAYGYAAPGPACGQWVWSPRAGRYLWAATPCY